MNNVIIDRWRTDQSVKRSDFTVLPDGCRDLILKVSPQGQQHYLISPYFHSARTVVSAAGCSSQGFRLAPGATIDEQSLMAKLSESICLTDSNIVDLVNEFVSISVNTQDALKCLESNPLSVTQSAKNLGVHPRTLQRLVFKETGLSPSYWLRLARIRQAGRFMACDASLVNIAQLVGYSDQSHMTRECVHWFGVTPSKLKKRSDLLQQLNCPAFS